MMTTRIFGVKMIGESIDGRVGGYLVIWGDPDHRDLENEYFTPETKLWLDIYDQRPVLYHHGLDGELTSEFIGVIDTLKADATGVWAEAQLDLRNRYVKEVLRLIAQGVLNWSSGTLPQLVEVDESGKILNWPIIEGSLTPTPAEPRKTDVSLIKSAYKSMGLSTERLLNNEESLLTKVTSKSAGAGVLRARPTEGHTSITQTEGVQVMGNLKDVVEEPEVGYLKSLLLELDLLADDATDEEYLEAKEAFKAIVEGKLDGGDVEVDGVPVKMDIPALLAALGLPPDATPDDVMMVIDEIFTEEESGDGMASADSYGEGQGKSITIQFDHDKLARARARAREGVVVNNDLPRATGQSGKRKSINLKNIYQGRNTPKPGLKTMLMELRYGVTSGKAVSYNLGPTGGYILEHEVAEEFIPALRDALPLFDMGVDRYDMEGIETMTVLKDSTEPTAYWVAEGTEVPESDEKVGGILLVPKPLAVRIPIPNKFLTNARVNYEQRIRDKITYAINRALMIAALRGDGGVSGSNTGASPVGVLNWTAVTSSELGSGNGRKPTLKDLIDMIGDLEDANVDEDDTWAWLFNPRTKRTFTGMADGDGLPILRERWGTGEERDLLGIPYYTSNVILRNRTVGTSTDCSNIYLGRWSSMALGISDQIEFMVDPYSLSSKLQTQVIAHIYADLRSKYDEAFSIRTGVRK